jgi:hypothetical protein
MIRNAFLLSVCLLATSAGLSAAPAAPSPTPVPTPHVLAQPQAQRGSLNDRVQALKKKPAPKKDAGKTTATPTVAPKP